MPAHRTVVFAIVALAVDQHVAVAVPAEGALVEDELIPADGGSHGTGIDLGHASDRMRSRRQSLVFHIGHPDGDTLLVVARSIGGIPAQAGHRGGGHTGLGQLSGEEEVLSNAVVVEGVEGEVGSSGSTLTDLNLKRSGSSATTGSAQASVVVGSHGAAFTVEVLSVEGHLAIFGSRINPSADDYVVINRELVDGILTFRNLGEGQSVVVVKHGRRDLRRNAFVGVTSINGAEVVSHLNHIGAFRSIELNHDGPDVSGAVAFGDGHELTLDDTGVGSVDIHNQLNAVGIHLEGQFFAFNTEHTVAGREVQNVDSVDRTFAVHGEVEG
ncbi:MAG: hypothetical protein AUK63_2187, partial [bacterium P3]